MSTWDDEQTGAVPQLPPPPPLSPYLGGPQAPGSVYDAGLSNNPFPAPPIVDSPSDARVYDAALSHNPWLPSGDTTQMSTAFVTSLRTEIRQLEGYFTRQTRKFRFYGMTTLACAGAVPVLVAADVWPWLVALFGATAAITGSAQTLYRFQDSGLSAMSLSNRLEAEVVRYETGTAPYIGGPHGPNFNLLVDRVTTLREDASASFHGVWSSAGIKSG